jgi:two-component system sensor histidine kinase AlgZ
VIGRRAATPRARSTSVIGARLPREVVWVYLATPLVTQPIVNPDVFDEPPARLALEIAANYFPATAILLALVLAYRWVVPHVRVQDKLGRVAVHTVVAIAAAALASVLVHPLHVAVTGEHDVPLAVYLQRNIGFTLIIVLPALLLDLQRTRARSAELELARQQQHALRAQLEALRARTHPHFVFNVLNTIASLIHDDADQAEQTVHRLAEILRYALESTRSDSVPLARELEVVLAYLEIQRARYGEKLRWELAIEPGSERLAVPPLSLQPLVENAVLHAVAPRTRGGTVWISAARRGERLELRVDDDGPGPGASSHHGSRTSLVELERRLALGYGDTASMHTRSNAHGGFTVALALPIAEAT